MAKFTVIILTPAGVTDSYQIEETSTRISNYGIAKKAIKAFAMEEGIPVKTLRPVALLSGWGLLLDSFHWKDRD